MDTPTCTVSNREHAVLYIHRLNNRTVCNKKFVIKLQFYLYGLIAFLQVGLDYDTLYP